LRLHKIRLVHDLREVIAGLDGLTEREAVGIEVGRVACIAAGVATTNSVLFINTRLPRISTHLDLSDDETLALLNLLTETIEADRYQFSPRIRTLRGILAKIRPNGTTATATCQTAYPAHQQRGHTARQRPANNLEAPGLPSKGRAPRHAVVATPA